MPFLRPLLRFLRAESGAVTVDWVVLTAAITGLGLASAAAVRTGTADLGSEVSTSLSEASVADLGCMGAGSGQAGFECYTGPTITGTGNMMGYAWMPACYFTPGGGMTCEGSGGSEISEEFFMSDGSTYIRTTRNEDGRTTVTWTDGSGQRVDEPPPQV